MKYRRINLFGGSGVGKSICAAKLFGDLKLRGSNRAGIEICKDVGAPKAGS